MPIDISSNRKVRILIADDHPLLRSALRNLLEKQVDFEVVDEADNGEMAVRLARNMKPDIVIMDISMPKLSGLEATKQIKAENPGIAILILTVHEDIEHVLEVLKAGAAGYLVKSVFGDEVLTALRAVATGERVLSPDVLQQVINRTQPIPCRAQTFEMREKLTTRELQILRLAARCMANNDIARALSLRPSTVKGYLAEIFSKLMVGSRTEAVIKGIRTGLLTLNDLG